MWFESPLPKTTTWKKTGLNWGKRYYFKVRAYRTVYGSTVEGKDSAAREIKVLKPPRMTGVTARNLTDGRVELTLKPGNYHGYEIRQATAQNGAYAKIYDIAPSWFTGYAPTYVINRADIGRPCWYKVVGYRFVNGVSGTRLYADDSNIVPATARPAKATIDKIENITGPPQGVKLYIKNLFCTGYDIYRAEGSPSSTYNKVKTIELNGEGDNKQEMEGGPDENDFAVWTDTTITSGKSYYYQVIPFAADYGVKINGEASEVKNITAP
jgi:hypothetical protein